MPLKKRTCQTVQTRLYHGEWRTYPNTCSYWVKTQRPQRRRNKEAKANVYSKRFGYLNSYTDKEQALLKCPSGYSLKQGMGALFKIWRGYINAKRVDDLERMKKYAHKIQDIQNDVGLATTSFPHLGIYGEQLTLFEHGGKKNLENEGNIAIQVDHTHLKDAHDLEEKKKEIMVLADSLPASVSEIVANAVGAIVPPLIEPDVEKGEALVTMQDEIPQPQDINIKISHSNKTGFQKPRDYGWTCEFCNKKIKPNKAHICKEEPKEEETAVTYTDDIPFLDA